jgi:hypothetical protein
VLEGSVQKSSTRVTITAQLIHGLTGAHLWAERFDRGVEDIATVLDDLTEIIVAGLATTYGGRLGKAWRGPAERNEARQNFMLAAMKMPSPHWRNCIQRRSVFSCTSPQVTLP